MDKKLGFIVLILGVALILAALLDVFGLSAGFNLDLGDFASFSEWPFSRIAILLLGVALGVWGAYSLSMKKKKKK